MRASLPSLPDLSRCDLLVVASLLESSPPVKHQLRSSHPGEASKEVASGHRSSGTLTLPEESFLERSPDSPSLLDSLAPLSPPPDRDFPGSSFFDLSLCVPSFLGSSGFPSPFEDRVLPDSSFFESFLDSVDLPPDPRLSDPFVASWISSHSTKAYERVIGLIELTRTARLFLTVPAEVHPDE